MDRKVQKMTREEALKQLEWNAMSAIQHELDKEVIHSIFNDIGSCGECERGILVDGPNDIDVVECFYEQTYSGFYEIDHFCKNFKREKND